MEALFACTKCHSRHPFEDLSSSEQLCKACQKPGDVVRCIYCRHEFHADEKNGHNAVCKHCTHHLKIYGKPRACDYCKEIAAFVGRKCHRCSHQEKKYGRPKMCERCKNMCAFDRGVDYRNNMECKWLCWLCIVAYKRAKKRGHSTNHASPFTPTNHLDKNNFKLLPFSDLINNNNNNNNNVNTSSGDARRASEERLNVAPSPKRRKTDNNSNNKRAFEMDCFSSEYLSTISQLRETVEGLKKQLQQKDTLLTSKDCQITELKAQIYEVEKKTRGKVEQLKKSHDESVDSLLLKMRELQRTLATYKKTGAKR